MGPAQSFSKKALPGNYNTFSKAATGVAVGKAANAKGAAGKAGKAGKGGKAKAPSINTVAARHVNVNDIKGGYVTRTQRMSAEALARTLNPSLLSPTPLASVASLTAARYAPGLLSPKPMGPLQAFTARNPAALASMNSFQSNYEGLGSLSRQYEAHGPGTVSTGKGDFGGVSYGSYQMATNNKSVNSFVASLQATHPQYHAALSVAEPGSPAFSKAWKSLAAEDPKGFYQAQHDYIHLTHFNVASADVKKQTGLELGTRTHTLRNVAWSTAVHHGPYAVGHIFSAALRGRDPATVSDADLIGAVYAERGRVREDGKLAWFHSSSEKTQRSIADRFSRESQQALSNLAHENAFVSHGD